jgi:superfamily I DNA/RNA helicase
MHLVRPDDWRPQGIADLEDRAWTAVRETGRSVCVTAGAGAGKTELLAQKAAYLLQTGLCPAPRRVLAISFKRDAAKTIADRVRLRVPTALARRFVSLTFDAWTKGMLDQFRRALPAPYVPSADYGIGFLGRDELDDFLALHDSDLNRNQLERLVAGAPVPIGGHGLPSHATALLEAFWHRQYGGRGPTVLTFAMINRLVECVLRTNPAVRDALLATYPFVFLDEFQDTTGPQYDIVVRAFDPAVTRVTTVGDDKQRIMGWAGAMPNGFEVFTRRFDAVRVPLLSNWRSHGYLVAVQRRVASRIDAATEDVVARGARAVDGAVCAICVFPDRESEVRELALWIARAVDVDGLEPERLAVLVRSLPDRVEDELRPAFPDGIALRNVARVVGGVAIQDTLAEDLTALLMPFLRLGVSRRAPATWSAAVAGLGGLRAVHEDDEDRSARVQRDVEALAVALRTFMTTEPPGPRHAERLTEMLLAGIGPTDVRQAIPAYRREVDFERVRRGFTELLAECLDGAAAWAEALDRFEGKGQVPLMTVHKSKGMEFHTVVFFGLDDKSWWSLKPDAGEELRSFFVALTRAEQRAFFTCCTERGGPISWLEQLLGPSVPKLRGFPREES